MEPKGARSKGAEGPCVPWIICPFLALGSNNKYSNKIIAEMLHLSTETYNNEKL